MSNDIPIEHQLRHPAQSIAVIIACPQCKKYCTAKEEWYEDDPWWTYVHHCEHCGYMIMESEWNVLKPELGRGGVIECVSCREQFDDIDGYFTHQHKGCKSTGLIIARKRSWTNKQQ